MITLLCIPENADVPTSIGFFVTNHTNLPLLGCRTCEVLGLVERVCELSYEKPLTNDTLINDYQDVFIWEGELEQPYHIELQDDVQLVIQTTRTLQYTRVERLKKALDKVEKDGMVADVNKPTPWVNNLVLTEKRNNRRIQLYLRMSHTLKSQAVYAHAICSASEVLQKRMQLTFGDIKGAHEIADDIIIAGDDERDHDDIRRAVFQRARERNVNFNSSKVELKVSEVLYMGHIVSDAGLSPDPEKVKAIVAMPLPDDKRALLRFLNILRYQEKCIHGESHITAPLSALLKEDAAWCWLPEHTAAVNQLKGILSSKHVLKFYDVRKPVTLQSDASQHGLSALTRRTSRRLRINGTCGSRTALRTAGERATCCSVRHEYVSSVHLWQRKRCADRSQAVEVIMKKPIGNATARVQRMMLKLQRYTINLVYVTGKHIHVADALSRAYIEDEADCGLIDDIDVMVHGVTQNSPEVQNGLNKSEAQQLMMQLFSDYIRS